MVLQAFFSYGAELTHLVKLYKVDGMIFGSFSGTFQKFQEYAISWIQFERFAQENARKNDPRQKF